MFYITKIEVGFLGFSILPKEHFFTHPMFVVTVFCIRGSFLRGGRGGKTATIKKNTVLAVPLVCTEDALFMPTLERRCSKKRGGGERKSPSRTRTRAVREVFDPSAWPKNQSDSD